MMNNYILETICRGLLGLKVSLDYLSHFIAISNIFYLQFITNKPRIRAKAKEP